MEKVLVTTILVIIDSGETHQWMSNHWLGDSWGEEYSHSLKSNFPTLIITYKGKAKIDHTFGEK